jgi:hypothetical protein
VADGVVVEKTQSRRDCGGGGRNFNDLPYFVMVVPGDGITVWSYAPEQKARRRSRCVRKIDLREPARDRHKGVAAGDNVTFDMTKSWTRSGFC